MGYSEGTLGIVSWLLDPDFLLALVILNAFIAMIRVWATTDAWRAAGGRWAGVGLLVLLIFVGLPHAALGYYGLKSRSTINAVFPTGPQVTPPVTMTTVTTISSTTTTTRATTTTFGTRAGGSVPGSHRANHHDTTDHDHHPALGHESDHSALAGR